MTGTATKPGKAKAAAPAKRVSLSQVVEMLLQRGGGEHSSVTLSRNAKGETQIEVVVRTADTGEVQTIDQAAGKAQELYDRMRARYPMMSGNVGATPSS